MSAVADFIRETTTIPALKLVARQHYLAYERAVGSMSCGRSLAEHISGEAAERKAKFNATMDKLAAIDPTCPEFRL
jgi:hypothetical protein